MSNQKDSAAESAIVAYLERQNRPYSAIDIFNNLHKEFGKTLVVKTLESLGESRRICEKTYGKQKVYLADQSCFAVIDDAELKEMDAKIGRLTEDVQRTKTDQRRHEVALRSLTSSLTTAVAEGRLNEVTTECDTFRERVKKLQANLNGVSPEERHKVISERTKYAKEWRKRKRMTNDILNAILEGYPKKKRDLQEEMGIETDEDVNAKPLEVG